MKKGIIKKNEDKKPEQISLLNKAYKAAYLALAILAIPSGIFAAINSYMNSRKIDVQYEKQEKNEKLSRINEYNKNIVSLMVSNEFKLERLVDICLKSKQNKQDLEEFEKLHYQIKENIKNIITSYQEVPIYFDDGLSKSTSEYLKNITVSRKKIETCPKGLDPKIFNQNNYNIRINYMIKSREYIKNKFPQPN